MSPPALDLPLERETLSPTLPLVDRATVDEVPLPLVGGRRRHRRGRASLAWRALRHRLEFACLVVFGATAARLPRSLWLWCGARLGDAFRFLGVRRRIVRRNMEFVGLWSAAEQRRIVRDLYRNIGRYAADFLRPARTLPPAHIEDPVLLQQRLRADHGSIVLFAHLGNWEMLPALLQQQGRPVVIIAKPMENPLVEGWVRQRRQQAGILFAAPAAALRHCLRALRGKGLVGLAIDQYPGRHATPTAFLGRVTRTVRSSAGLAVHTGSPVTGVFALLDADGAYRVSVRAVPLPSAAAATGADAVSETLQAHSAAISAWVRAHPEHWFGWFHRRFKDSVRY